MRDDALPVYTSSLRGLGRVTTRELRQVFGDAVSGLQQGRTRNLDLTRFRCHGGADALWQLGTVEDVYLHLDTLSLEGGRADLEHLQRVARRRVVATAVAQRDALGGRRARRPRVRVVVQASDQPWRRYHRRQLEAALLRGLLAAQPGWRAVDDDADLEFWVQLVDRQAWVGLRLTDARMRHRDYKVEHREGSLRPTVARAMAFLGGAGDTDVVVDPVCGAGTLLIERALLGRCGALLGGDRDPQAPRQGLANFGRRHRPRALCVWDVASLPVRAGSVDVILANLPWGRRVATDAARLYPAALAEAARVLRPGGRAVLLTSATDALAAALAGTPQLFERERVRGVAVLGRDADLVVVEALA